MPRAPGAFHGLPDGVGLFVDEDGAYTTVAAAVSMLVVLALVFAVATAAWSMSRAGDVQACADATVLSGSNVVASYSTAATVVDASILSLGLAGLAMTGVGFVGLFVPGAETVAIQAIDTGMKTLDLRNDFAKSASRGLSTLEKSLPVLVAARSMRTASSHSGERTTCWGVAVTVPMTSESDFAAMEGEQVPLDGLEQSAGELESVSEELRAAQERTADAKRRAWLADCGREGHNMQERASSLTGLSADENPDFSSSVSWSPEVGLARARSYYRWRLANERPSGPGVEAAADSAARSAFYEFALERMEEAEIVSTDESFSSTLDVLPRNTDEVRGTSLYTDARWPVTVQDAGRTLHYGTGCPGATGGRSGAASVADVEAGRVAMCPECRFDVGDLGKTPAASTSIDNGFEFHLREYTLALQEYEACRNEELALQAQAREEASAAVGEFGAAVSSLSVDRPRIAPPGRYGCIGLALLEAQAQAHAGAFPFASTVEVGKRVAVSAAVLAPEGTEGGNVLSEFFSGIERRVGGGGAVGLLDGVMDVWGSLLVSYGDASDALGKAFDSLLGGLDAFGAGGLADWLAGGLRGVVEGLGFAPVDLRLKKPVLTNTQNVLGAAGLQGAVDLQELARSLPAGVVDPASALEALGYRVGDYLMREEFTLAEIPVPGTDLSIPLTIRLTDLVGGGS